MIDCISGGCLIAGFQVGSQKDTCYAYARNPSMFYDRCNKAHDLMLKTSTNKDTFAFNGRYNQQCSVKFWSRPVQDPHPPIWAVPASLAAV